MGGLRCTWQTGLVNPAQKALLARLRQIVEETPTSGALNSGKKPLYVGYFARAVENRSEDGGALVAYARDKVYKKATATYNALIVAGRPDLTVEAVVADADAPWASEFSDADRAAARERLGAMIEAHREEQEAAEAASVAYDMGVVADVSAKRIAKGNPALTPEQEATMLQELAARRAAAKAAASSQGT
jgi:hypothetical protein